MNIGIPSKKAVSATMRALTDDLNMPTEKRQFFLNLLDLAPYSTSMFFDQNDMKILGPYLQKISE